MEIQLRNAIYEVDLETETVHLVYTAYGNRCTQEVTPKYRAYRDAIDEAYRCNQYALNQLYFNEK